MKRIQIVPLFTLCVYLLGGSLTAAAADAAPVAENLELTTCRSMSVGGRLKAFDPEGEEVYFRITTEPRKGTLTLGEGGEFVYTPAEGKRGRDYFGYCAADPNGNVSQEATVVITIRKAGKGVDYRDTAGLSCEYAAYVLAEEGLFTGRNIGGEHLFEPEEPVTRGEFLMLCMNVAGTVSAEDVDAANERAEPKGCSVFSLGETSLNANLPVTLGEAAQTIADVLHIASLSPVSAEDFSATQALISCGLLSSDMDTETVLNRAQTAELLLRAMQLLEKSR